MQPALLKKIRRMVLFFVIALAISGITAFPVYSELKWILESGWVKGDGFLSRWLNEVYTGVADAMVKYPFLFYGFDWLAFAHIMIACLFYGVYKDPLKNKFIVSWAMFCCVAIIPLAFICGPIRNIPMTHILIDCSFGIFGIIPLLLCKKWINELDRMQTNPTTFQ